MPQRRRPQQPQGGGGGSRRVLLGRSRFLRRWSTLLLMLQPCLRASRYKNRKDAVQYSVYTGIITWLAYGRFLGCFALFQANERSRG